MEELTKKCPFCAEEIKVEAIKCKHCGSILTGQEKVEPKKKRRINPLVLLLLIVILAVGSSAGWYYLYGPCGKISVEKTLNTINELVDDWYDAEQLASSTSRIALSGPIKDLQDIANKLENVESPKCLHESQTTLSLVMENSIEGYIAFASQESDTVITNKFNAAKNYFTRYIRLVEEVKDCYPFCFDK